MPFFDRQRLSDETIEQIRRALRDAGTQPPSEPAATEHLSAMLAESRRVREGTIEHTAQPASPRRLRSLPRRIAASAAASTAFVTLAVAGVLPGPVQAAASDVLAVVGISIPDGGDERSEAGGDRDGKQERGEPTPTSTSESRPTVGEDRGPPRQDAGGVAKGPQSQDQGRSNPSGSADDSTTDDGGGRADDDANRESNEEGRDADQQGKGEDGDGGGQNEPGSGSDEEQAGDPSEIPGGGVTDDEEGPDAGVRPSEEADEADKSGEDRSGPGGGSLPDSGDELEAPEE